MEQASSTGITLKLRGRLIDLREPRVMAIAIFTPDSFYAGSRHHIPSLDGVLILDLGGCSTRPGSTEVSEEEEIRRLREGIAAARTTSPDTLLSIDTFRPSVIRTLAAETTIDIINDVYGGSDEMYEVAAETGAAYVLTYPEGGYSADMLLYFSERIDRLCRLGVNDILLDPGFGFGKTTEQNWEIARNMHVLRELERPVLVGISRKSMLRNLLGIDTEHALNATTALHAFLLERGAHILRVHDTEEAVQAVRIYQQLHPYAALH